MHYEKAPQSAVSNNGRHTHRLIQNDKNTDIDIKKTKKNNLCITPYIKEVNGKICDITKVDIDTGDVVKPITRDNYFEHRAEIQKLEYQHYKDRKSELYCYNRKDVKTMVNVVVTLPKELTSKNDIDLFWDKTVSFISERYGSENLISAVRHADEKEIGREHIHVSFIPACAINHEKLMAKKNHVKEMEKYTEKISANDVLTKRDMRTVHKDFQKYIDDAGLKCKVVTKSEGSGKSINLSVEQLKEITEKTGITIDKPITIEEFVEMVSHNREIEIVDRKLQEKVEKLEKENSALRLKVKSLEKQLEHQQNHSWQRSQEQTSKWNHDRSGGWGTSKESEIERKW